MDFNKILVAAKERLGELRKELGRFDVLKEEERKLSRLLKSHGRGVATTTPRGRKAKGTGPARRRGKGPSKLNLAVEVLKKSKGGLMVKEMLAQLRKSHPGLFNEKGASALLSRALNQSLKAKAPRVKVVAKGGPGKPAKYGAAAASAVSSGPKAKGKGGRRRSTGGPSKLALATEVLKKSKEGMTVTEMLERLRKSHADQFKAKNANKMLATALREATKARPPVVKVLAKGGRGKPSTYGAAA